MSRWVAGGPGGGASLPTTDEQREQYIPARLDDDALRAAYRSALRPVTPTLAFAEVAGATAIPRSVGTDGLVYGSQDQNTNRIVRSGDGFATVETGFRFSDLGDGRTLRHVTRIAEGYVAVLSGTTAEDAGAVYFSTSFTTGWAKVLDLGHVLPISVGRPYAVTGEGTIMTLGEYGNGDTRRLYLLQFKDGAATARIIKTHTRQPGGTSNNNHCHGSTYDPVTDRIWFSGGDGPNNWFGYTADWRNPTPTWVEVPANGIGPEDAGTRFNHPTVVTPTSSRIITTPDGNAGGIGVWELDRDTGRARVAHEVASTEPYRHWCRAPWVQDGDEVYLMFPPDQAAGEVEKILIAATGDGGQSWHTVYSLPIDKATETFYDGIVGPDAGGRVYLYGNRNGTRRLYSAPRLKWEAAVSTGRLRSNVGNRVLATLTSGGTAVNTATATDLGKVTIPRGVARPGDIVRAVFFGDLLNNSAANINYSWSLRLGATTAIATSTFGYGVSANRRNWRLAVDVLPATSGTHVLAAQLTIANAGTVTMPISASNTVAGVGYGTATEDLAGAAKALTVAATMGTADPAADVVLRGATLELLKQ